MTDAAPGSTATTAELISRLADDTAELVRQEIALARAEAVETARRAAAGVGLLGGAGVLGGLALAAASTSLLRALETVLPRPAAAPVLTAAYVGGAAALAAAGVERLRAAGPLVPERTIRTVKEDLKWAARPTSTDPVNPSASPPPSR